MDMVEVEALVVDANALIHHAGSVVGMIPNNLRQKAIQGQVR